MRSRMISPPASLPVALADARMALRYEATDTAFDAIISAWLFAITEHAEHFTGRAFISQGWRATADTFPDAIRLRPPVIAVQSVKYYDANYVLRTLDPADYQVDAVSEPGFVVIAPGKAWPKTAPLINAVTVDYTCGYGDTPDSVPKAVQTYVLAKLAEQFDPGVMNAKDSVQASYIDRLLDRVRIMEFG